MSIMTDKQTNDADFVELTAKIKVRSSAWQEAQDFAERYEGYEVTDYLRNAVIVLCDVYEDDGKKKGGFLSGTGKRGRPRKS